MTEYVKIYCCGDCGYYDWRKHKCQRGAKVDDGSRFFRDCPIGIHEEKDGERVDTVPVVHGRWINGKCDKCGGHAPFWSMATTYYPSKFCPHCGAKMYEKDGDNG